MRYAITHPSFDGPLVYSSKLAALNALVDMPDFPDAALRPVRNYRDSREARAFGFTNTEAGGFGGVFRDSQGRQIVLGQPVIGLELCAFVWHARDSGTVPCDVMAWAKWEGDRF